LLEGLSSFSEDLLEERDDFSYPTKDLRSLSHDVPTVSKDL